MLYSEEPTVLALPHDRLRDCLQARTAPPAKELVSFEIEAGSQDQLPNIAGAVPQPQPNVPGGRLGQALPRPQVSAGRPADVGAQRKVQDETAQAGAQEIAQRCAPPVLG